MRATRVIYVEDDPALRGIVSHLLASRPELEVLAVAANSQELLAADVPRADVALLDLALGSESLTGIELGLLLKARQPDLGAVIFTQHVVPEFVVSLPDGEQMGWSFMEKRADLDLDALVDVLRATARGMNVVDPAITSRRASVQDSPIDGLTVRQRELMALLASGQEAAAIARTLGLSAASVRKELSRAYAVLVPDAAEGTDIRTVAVLRYLRAVRSHEVIASGVTES